MVLGALDDAVNSFLESEIGSVDNQIRHLSIEFFAKVEQGAESLDAVFHVDEGPVAAASKAARQAFDVGGQPNDEAESADPGPVLRAKHDAAACRDHVKVDAGNPREHRRFPFAEAFFTFLCEYLRNAHPAFFDDKFIGIKDAKAQARGDLLGDGGFPAAHHADQQYIAGARGNSGGSRHMRAKLGEDVDG